MKLQLVFGYFILVYILIDYSNICNKKILNIKKKKEIKKNVDNNICNISYSCCSNQLENYLLKEWNTNDNINIQNYYSNYLKLLNIFIKNYTLFEDIAKKNILLKNNIEISNYFIFNNDVKILKKSVKYIKETFNIISYTRKGFYCSICEISFQKYFNFKDNSITYSSLFCTQLSSNTIKGIYHHTKFIYNYINSLNNLLNSEFIKNYTPVNILKISKSEEDIINNCYNTNNCINLCKLFKITKISPIIDGDLNILSSILKKMIKYINTNNINIDIPIDIDTNNIQFYNNNVIQYFNNLNPKVEPEGINFYSMTLNKSKFNYIFSSNKLIIFFYLQLLFTIN